MIVKINNETVTIKGNPVTSRNVKEELDSGAIVIESTKATRYEMYDIVDITTPFDNEEQYLIQADNPVQLNATEYQHNITLFENIAYFNTIFPADRSFKIVGQTLEDILTAYQRELSHYHNIEISWSTIPQAVLDETIPFKEFSGLNFSTILLSLFRKIWAVPKVNRILDVWDIYPLYHSERNNSISSDSISKISQQNNIDYATKVKSQLKNAVNERTETEIKWFPSESGYVLPRSSSLQTISSNLRYELDSNAISIVKAEAVDVTLTTVNINDSVITTYTNITIDITDQIVQDEIWDLLTVIDSTTTKTIAYTDNAKNHIRFKVGQPHITNLFEASTDKIFFTNDTEYLINAIWRGFYKQYSKSSLIDNPNSFTGDTEDVKMRFKYIRQRNMDMVHTRKTKGNMNDTTATHQQRDSSVEVNEYKKNLKIYANRMGNNETSKTKVFTYPDEPYELFDYTDEKTIVTKVQNTWHNKFVYCEYEESENFSNIEAEYALMRRSDPYSITAKSVTTNLIEQEYVEFSEVKRTSESRLTDNAQRLVTGLFEEVTLPYEPVAIGVFKPILASWNSDYAIHMPVESSGDGNLITIHNQFSHQNIAGKTYYDLDADTYQSYLNPLPYTDTDGTLEDYQLYYTPDILFEDSGEYPLILDETAYLAAKYTSGITQPLDLDSAASFSKTFQLSLIADDIIYIGDSLSQDNYLIKSQLTSSAIKIYTSTKPYGQYDQTYRTSDTDNTANITYSYSYTNKTITITPSIAIDYFSIVKDDKILLAINKSLAAGESMIIYINYFGEFNIVYIEAYATDLENLTANSILEYTFRLYDLEALGDIDYNLVANSILEYSMRIYPLEANSATLANLSGTVALEYTNRLYSLEAYGTNLENLIGTVDLTYNYLTAYGTNIANLTGTCSISVPASLVEWVEVSSGTVTIDQCLFTTDVGNIKQEPYQQCTFTQDGAAYNSSTDESTTQPVCSVGAEYTVCIPFGGSYFCRDYIGENVTLYDKYECQLK